jgi:Ca2+-binding RTX toxin-like protein
MDLRGIDFSVLFDYSQKLFLNDINAQLDGTDFPNLTGTYIAEDAVALSDDPNYDPYDPDPATAPSSASLFGTGFEFGSGYFNPTAGVLSAIILKDFVSDDYFGIYGVSLSLTSVAAAAQTASLSDDRALITTILAGNDSIFGSAFGDYLFGGAGQDSVTGGGGNDSLRGDAGNDSLNGGSGNDSLDGGANNDALLGGTGNDTLRGGTGADRLTGSEGRDLLDAGVDSASDLFIFSNVSQSVVGFNRDQILHFDAAHDVISLSVIDANGAAAGNGVFAFSTTGPAAYSVWTVDAGDNLRVFADVNGNKAADFEILLMGVSSVDASNFVL